MHAAVESADSPDGTEPRKHERPTCRPGSEVLGFCKYVFCVVAFCGEVFANGEGNDGSDDEDEIHYYEDGLQLAHDFGERGSEDAVAEDAGKKDSVDDTVAGCPFSVSRDDDAS